MQLWTAFLLGLIGSLHCAGMCGPLMLALPVPGNGSSISFFLGRLLNTLGRITTYVVIGLVFGILGKSFAIAGLQQWVSLIAGSVILIGLILSTKLGLKSQTWKFVGWLKAQFAHLLRERSYFSLFLLGAINGLLPCGLVYAAAAGAIASGDILESIKFMLAFGLGTMPMMLSIGLLGRKLQSTIGFKLQRLIPASVALLGLLLVLRGLALGIPYLSPILPTGVNTAHCSSCH